MFTSTEPTFEDALCNELPHLRESSSEMRTEFMNLLELHLGITDIATLEERLFFVSDSDGTEYTSFAQFMYIDIDEVVIPDGLVIDWLRTYHDSLAVDFKELRYDGVVYFFINE